MELGYNVAKINQLMKDVTDSCIKVRTYMSDGWPSVQTTLQKEWVGGDEQSYEKQFVARIIELWQTIQQNCNKFLGNIQQAGQSWTQFQASNTIEGAGPANAGAGRVNFEPLDAADPDVAFKKVDITEDMDRGLQNGVKSAGSITTAIKEYIKGVYNNTKGIFEQLDASTSFIGEEQSAQVKSYIEEMGLAFARVTTSYNDLNVAMETLIRNYTQQSRDVVEATSGTPNIDTDGKSMMFN